MPEAAKFEASNVVALSAARRAEAPLFASGFGAPKQLELALDGARTILFSATSQIHGATFLRNVELCQPRLILDLRFAPHFEFTATKGDLVLRLISQAGIGYVWYGVPFHEYSESLLRHNAARVADEVVSAIARFGEIRGPAMVLVEHPEDAQRFAAYLAGAMQRAEGGSWKALAI